MDRLDEEDGFPYVKFANGKELKILQYAWVEKQKKRSGNGLIVIKQLPLKLAAALTVHKSQSISLDYVKLNLGPGIFAGGQAYTGLSRCRTLAGLCLTDFHSKSVKANPKVYAFYKKYGALKHSIIEDGEENEEVKKLVMQLLLKHIPSALAPIDTRKRRGNRSMRNTKRTKSESPVAEVFQDEDCPF